MSEPTFGILKEQLGARRFLLRGLANVRAEFTLMATAFNLRTLSQVWARLKQGTLFSSKLQRGKVTQNIFELSPIHNAFQRWLDFNHHWFRLHYRKLPSFLRQARDPVTP